MDLRQLQALVAIGEHGSFSAAAQSLHTVQSNVSTHIARLERELGAQLVDRQAGALTEEGSAVAARARRAAAEIDAIRSDLAAMHDEIAGPVRIGMIGTTARWLVPPLIDRLASEHPQVHLVVGDGTSVTLQLQLVAGALDAAVVNLPHSGVDLTARPLFDEDLVLVLPRDHPLAGRESLAMADLAGLPLLLPAAGSSYREELDDAARAASMSLTAKAELDGLRLIASLTARGYGPAILPATGMADSLEGFRPIPVSGLPRRRVGVALRRRSQPSAPTRAALDILQQVVRENLDAGDGLHAPSPSQPAELRAQPA